MRHSNLAEFFGQVRAHTDALAAPLSSEDQTVQSMPDASPTKWHLAHTSWFFETFLLKQFVPGYRPYNPKYEVLFNSYYNTVGEQFARAKRGLLSRPGSEDIRAYRRHIDREMSKLLASPSDDVFALTELGLHHEQQHQELLLTDIKHALSLNPLYPVYVEGPGVPDDVAADTSQPATFVGFEGGTIEIGHGGDSFHYDNESPRHRTLIADFELASRPLNNAEVLTFIDAGGYDNPLLWLSDGWAFRTQHALTHPLHWVEEAGNFQQFTLHGLQPLVPLETACHLSYFEADAMARFFGARLPTEQEWEHAACSTASSAPTFSPSAIRPGVPTSPETRAAGHLSQMLGGVWEWTASQYLPYPGYVAPPGAVGEYNGKFMHNQMVLRGGSCATSTGHARNTYRNFFPSTAQWQFTGARLARGNNTP